MRARSWLSRSPSPGCTTAAVAAQVRATWFWMMATRSPASPMGGPSCTATPANAPGRST